jgi:hypothetical protein
VRNHVIILPVDDLSNAACEAVANNIKGCMALPHPYGRLQFGADLDLGLRAGRAAPELTVNWSFEPGIRGLTTAKLAVPRFTLPFAVVSFLFRSFVVWL